MNATPLDGLKPTLAKLMTLMGDTGVQGVVIGGVAASSMGDPRYTRDVDATVELDNDGLAAFFAVATSLGLAPRRSDHLQFARISRMVLLHDTDNGVDLDLSMAIFPFEQEMIARAVPVLIGGQTIPLASPEDLVITKAVAHRDTDLVDVRRILQNNPNHHRWRVGRGGKAVRPLLVLDMNRVWFYVPQFAEAMDQPEIVEDLRRIVKEWGSESSRAKP